MIQKPQVLCTAGWAQRGPGAQAGWDEEPLTPRSAPDPQCGHTGLPGKDRPGGALPCGHCPRQKEKQKQL